MPFVQEGFTRAFNAATSDYKDIYNFPKGSGHEATISKNPDRSSADHQYEEPGPLSAAGSNDIDMLAQTAFARLEDSSFLEINKTPYQYPYNTASEPSEEGVAASTSATRKMMQQSSNTVPVDLQKAPAGDCANSLDTSATVGCAGAEAGPPIQNILVFSSSSFSISSDLQSSISDIPCGDLIKFVLWSLCAYMWLHGGCGVVVVWLWCGCDVMVVMMAAEQAHVEPEGDEDKSRDEVMEPTDAPRDVPGEWQRLLVTSVRE